MITPSYGLTATERVLPRMALDFTAASLDNRVTFTRALNTATVTNSSGYVTSINANLPRFDYDPITLLCKGLLIEESRVNSLPYSADLDNVLWLKSASSIGATKITSPSNTLSGQKLIESATNAQHIVYQGPLAFASAVYTMSAYFKAAERTQVYLRLDTSVTTRQAIFDLSAVTATPSAGCTAAIQSVGNGWYRGTITLSAAESINNAVLMLGSGGTSIYAGDGTSGAYFWGMQVEAGAFATSYIPTTTLAVTRNADVAVMTGTNFSSWFNASEGTFVCKASIPYTTSGNRGPWRVDGGDDSNRIMVRNEGGNLGFRVITNNVGYVSFQNAITVNTVFQHAGTYKVDSFAGALNGAGLSTDNSGVLPVLTRFLIGDPTGTPAIMGCTIARIFYYPQRLTDNEVVAFSKQ